MQNLKMFKISNHGVGMFRGTSQEPLKYFDIIKIYTSLIPEISYLIYRKRKSDIEHIINNETVFFKIVKDKEGNERESLISKEEFQLVLEYEDIKFVSYKERIESGKNSFIERYFSNTEEDYNIFFYDEKTDIELYKNIKPYIMQGNINKESFSELNFFENYEFLNVFSIRLILQSLGIQDKQKCSYILTDMNFE